MPITDQILDLLLADCKSPEDLMGEQGLLRQLTKKLAERALEAEMEHHLGYPKNSPSGKDTGNSRNGKTAKTVRSVHGDIELEIPRDRNSSFEPQLVKKSEKQLAGFDDRILSLYARGMSLGISRRILKKPMALKSQPHLSHKSPMPYNWSRLSVFFDYPPEIRKVIYTTNAIESLNASLRQVTKTRRSFPNDDAILKLLYLALHQIAKKWTMPIRDWKPAIKQFIIMYGDLTAVINKQPLTQKILHTHAYTAI